mmetsp:Transcript_59073/g.183086  ORF Transcript_59073/g.183086 Transcript_59073/m.183086 type:complete len:224 (-) Transcript_59073:3-674(-)
MPRSLKTGSASSQACFASSAFFFMSPFFSRCRLASTSWAAAAIFLSPSPLKMRTASSAEGRACSTFSALPPSRGTSARESDILASPSLSPAAWKSACSFPARASASLPFPVQQSTWATRRTASASPVLSPAARKISTASLAAFSASLASSLVTWPSASEISAAASRAFALAPACSATELYFAARQSVQEPSLPKRGTTSGVRISAARTILPSERRERARGRLA